MFEGFPTDTLSWEDSLELKYGLPEDLTKLIKYRMNYFVPDLLMAPRHLPTILHIIKVKPGITCADLYNELSDVTKPEVLRTAGWLIKLGLLRRQ